MKKFLGILGTFTLAFSGLATVACSFGVKEIESTAKIMKKNIEIASYVAKGAILSQQEGWDSSWTTQRMSTLNVQEELGEDFISKPNEDAPDENYIIKDLYNMTFGITNPELQNKEQLISELNGTPIGTPVYSKPNTDQYKNISNLVGTVKEFLANGLQAGQLDAALGVLGSQLSNLGIEGTIASIGDAIKNNAEIINTISKVLEKMSNRMLPIDATVEVLVKKDIDAIVNSIKNENGEQKDLILNIVIALLDVVELSTAFQNYNGNFNTFIISKLTDVNVDALAGTINLTNLFETLFSLFSDPENGTRFFEFITGYLGKAIELIKIPSDIDFSSLVEKILLPIKTQLQSENGIKINISGLEITLKLSKEGEEGSGDLQILGIPIYDDIKIVGIWGVLETTLKHTLEQAVVSIPSILKIVLNLFENDFESIQNNLKVILANFKPVVSDIKSLLILEVKNNKWLPLPFSDINGLLNIIFKILNINLEIDKFSDFLDCLTNGEPLIVFNNFDFKYSLYEGDFINDTIRALLDSIIGNLESQDYQNVIMGIFNLLNKLGIISEPITDYKQVKDEINKIKINHPIPNFKTISETVIPFINIRVIDLLDVLKQITKNKDGKDIIYDISKISALLDSLITTITITADENNTLTPNMPILLLSQIISKENPIDEDDYKNIKVTYKKYNESANDLEENENKSSASSLLHAVLGLVKKQEGYGVEFHKNGLLYGLAQVLGGVDSEMNKLAVNKILSNGYEYINKLVQQEEQKEKEYFKPYYQHSAWSMEIIKNEDPLKKDNEFILIRTNVSDSNMIKKFKFKLVQENGIFKLSYISLL